MLYDPVALPFWDDGEGEIGARLKEQERLAKRDRKRAKRAPRPREIEIGVTPKPCFAYGFDGNGNRWVPQASSKYSRYGGG
jgi:hypothetical protein